VNIPAANIDIDPRELARLLGWPVDRDFDERTRAKVARADAWFREYARPCTFRRILKIADLSAPAIRIEDGSEFICEPLARRIAQARGGRVAVIGVSAGAEVDLHVTELWAQDAYDEAIVLSAFAAAIAERLMAISVNTLCHEVAPDAAAILPHYCPGYEGWELDELPRLLALLADDRGLLQVNDGGMLLPQKSMLGVVGLTDSPAALKQEGDLVPCRACSFSPCRMRRVPFESATRSVADVGASAADAGVAPASTERRFAFNERALKKWATRYLELNSTGDGQMHARFTLKGTSCSNDPFDILYEVRLEAEESGFRIAGMECSVPDGQSAFDTMCEYRLVGAPFVASIASHRPFEGALLNEVLDWHPAVNPAGCLCETAHQDYKWRVVLQTILYELGQR